MSPVVSDPGRQVRATLSVVITPTPIATIRVALIRLDRTAASCVIAPFAIAAGSSEVPHDAPALREWCEASPLAFIAAGGDEDATPLDQDSVDVRGPVGAQLRGCDGPPYKGDITSWHSQDCLLQLVVAQGC